MSDQSQEYAWKATPHDSVSDTLSISDTRGDDMTLFQN